MTEHELEVVELKGELRRLRTELRVHKMRDAFMRFYQNESLREHLADNLVAWCSAYDEETEDLCET